MHRLFVGLRPPRAIREVLLGLMGSVSGARWQDDDQLHLTLRFIGEVERPIAEDVALALGQIVALPIEAALSGIGTFDRKGAVHTIWAGVAPRAPLASLYAKVDRALAHAGLAAEHRAYLPHITLARLPRAARADSSLAQFLDANAGLSSPAFALSHLTLFESHFGREGARYEIIEQWPLG